MEISTIRFVDFGCLTDHGIHCPNSSIDYYYKKKNEEFPYLKYVFKFCETDRQTDDDDEEELSYPIMTVEIDGFYGSFQI